MNILVIMSDQHHPRFMSCAGGPFAETPNLDRIARAGARFESACCPSPLCGPSRMSFLSGLYPCRTGVYANGQALPSDIPTLAHALGAAGYETALVGRMHIVGPDHAHGFERVFPADVTASTLGGGLSPILDGLHAGGGVESLTLSGAGGNPYQLYDDLVTRRACEFIASSDRRRPFAMVVGFALPHNPYVCSEEDYDRWKDRVRLPVVAPDDPGATHPALRETFERLARATAEDARRSLAAYCGSISALDRRVGLILDALERAARPEPTLMVYTSDHGEMAGEHGLWHKSCFFEAAVGVPLLMSLPGEIPAGVVLRPGVNLTDLTATLLDLAGAEPLPEADGRSFRALWRGGTWEGTVFSELGTRWRRSLLARMVRRGSMKYVYYHDLPDLLFDLERDPEERRNLAEVPEYAVLRAELRALVLHDWDPQVISKGLDRWKRRNGVIDRWRRAAGPPDPHIFRPPEGSAWLRDVPGFAPERQLQEGAY